MLARVLNSRPFAVVVPAAVGFGMSLLSIRGFDHYGGSLFLGVPIVVCFLSAYCTSFRRDVSLSTAYRVSLASLLLLGAFALALAIEGLICLLMAFPLAMLLGFLGAILGHNLASMTRDGRTTVLPVFVVLGFPGVVAVDGRYGRGAPERWVTTSVAVRAPIAEVWKTVIAFPRIEEAPSGVFRFGIAYPIEASIEGTGVGAVRHCVFSTGAFIEPITAWEAPTRLAFDVTDSPPPMKEFSPYGHMDAPHLHGFMNAHRGEFRLSEREGGVLLEGTTWYSHALAPQWYWGPISDFIIHRIHERVLNHIKRTSESGLRQ